MQNRHGTLFAASATACALRVFAHLEADVGGDPCGVTPACTLCKVVVPRHCQFFNETSRARTNLISKHSCGGAVDSRQTRGPSIASTDLICIQWLLSFCVTVQLAQRTTEALFPLGQREWRGCFTLLSWAASLSEILDSTSSPRRRDQSR